MNLFFDSYLVAGSNLGLKLFSKSLLLELLLATRIGLSGCLRANNLLVVVVRLRHIRTSLNYRTRLSHHLIFLLKSCTHLLKTLAYHLMSSSASLKIKMFAPQAIVRADAYSAALLRYQRCVWP